jgi:hypothetical protein
MVSNCNKFHFVQRGQTCATIAPLYSISVAQFVQWNPAAKSDCSGLWAETVGVLPSFVPPPSFLSTPLPVTHPLPSSLLPAFLSAPYPGFSL